MPHCPRCRQVVEAQAIRCGRCGLTLKAHGHPGIPLHRAVGEASLCTTCTYHADDSCTFPQRPLAQTCTLYQSIETLKPEAPLRTQSSQRRNPIWPWLGLLGMSLLIAWLIH